jgi:hypothetical protein
VVDLHPSFITLNELKKKLISCRSTYNTHKRSEVPMGVERRVFLFWNRVDHEPVPPRGLKPAQDHILHHYDSFPHQQQPGFDYPEICAGGVYTPRKKDPELRHQIQDQSPHQQSKLYFSQKSTRTMW